MSESQRDVMEYEVAIVGAGPAGLACAIRLKQLNPALSICVLEKAASLGAHSLSGAVMEPAALDELLPRWRENPPEICVPAARDDFFFMTRRKRYRARWVRNQSMAAADEQSRQSHHLAWTTGTDSGRRS